MRATLLLFLAGCSAASPAVPDAGTTPDAAEAGPTTIAEQTFGEPEAWASPIDDFLAVGQATQPGKFNASVNDLAPMGSRLFIGYGDADYNLGEKIPIEFRFFGAADDPEAHALNVDGAGQGEVQKTPLQSGEEQIDRYRLIDGTLYQAGIDSIDPDELWTQATTTPKAIDGNFYRLEGETWKKFRSIRGGEHVHDVMGWKGALYSVGSGADTRTEFEAGEIYRYLWKSTDHGTTFTTAQRVMHPTPGAGDIRWITILPAQDTLYLFGYQSDFVTSSAKIRNSSYDGTTVTDLETSHPLHDIFATNTVLLPDGTAIVVGTNVGSQKYTAGHFAKGAFTALSSIAGSRAVDVFLASTGEIVYLVTAGDSTTAKPTSWDVRILVAAASAPDETKELAAYTTNIRPTSIAYFGNHLFVGTADGHVLRTP